MRNPSPSAAASLKGVAVSEMLIAPLGGPFWEWRPPLRPVPARLIPPAVSTVTAGATRIESGPPLRRGKPTGVAMRPEDV